MTQMFVRMLKRLVREEEGQDLVDTVSLSRRSAWL